jgi:hypothetical protein
MLLLPLAGRLDLLQQYPARRCQVSASCQLSAGGSA